MPSSVHAVFDALNRLFGPLPEHTVSLKLELDFNKNNPPRLTVVSLASIADGFIDPSNPVTQKFKLEPSQ